MPRSTRPIGSLAMLLLSMVGAECAGDSAAGPPGLQVQATGPRANGDRLSVTGSAESVVIDIESQFGIGRAVLLPGSAGWPRQIRIRLHLTALEGFEAWADDRHYRYEVSGRAKDPPFEVMLPAGFVVPTTAEIRIEWVDRYRH